MTLILQISAGILIASGIKYGLAIGVQYVSWRRQRAAYQQAMLNDLKAVDLDSLDDYSFGGTED